MSPRAPDTLQTLLDSSLLNTLLENTPDFVYFKDRERRFVRVSKPFEALLGRSSEEIVGQRDEDLFPPPIAAETVADDRRVIEIGAPIINKLEGGEVREGRETWVLTTKIPWRDGDGNILGLFGISRDVSERKAMEDDLRESERQLREAESIGRLGSWALDLETQRVVGSDELFRIFGLEKGESSLQAFTGRADLDDEEAVVEHIRRAVQSGEPWEVEGRLELPEGGERFVHVKARGLGERARGHRKLIGTVQDTTERRRVEEERLAIERRLQQTQKLESLGVLAGGMAHDFNNLLSAMYGFLDLAEAGLPSASPVAAHIEGARLAANRAADLVEQLLAYAGRSRFRTEDLDLDELIDGMSALLGPTLSKKTTLELDLARDLPQVRGDAVQLRQVVMNLVINASEALGEVGGKVIVSTRSSFRDRDALEGFQWSEKLPEEEYVTLEVADTGHGMDEPTLARIFDPFFTTRLPGRGLGLAAVHGIVCSHGGAVRVASEVGKGAAFSILLPVVEPDDAARGTPRDGTSRRTARTVLLVDDEELLRNLGRQMLEQLGFETICAEDGEEAIEIFASRGDELACVLLDYAMPRLNGEECFARLRRIRTDIPVVLCSGYHDPGAHDRGFAGFLQKPFGLGDLERLLGQLVG